MENLPVHVRILKACPPQEEGGEEPFYSKQENFPFTLYQQKCFPSNFIEGQLTKILRLSVYNVMI